MKTPLFASLATAAALMGSAALADNTVTLSYSAFERDDINTSGLVYDFEGDVRGFHYDGYVFDGDSEDIDAKQAGAKIGWTGVNAFGFGVGPAVAYNYVSLGDTSADGWAGGVQARGALGRTEVIADALMSFDDSDVWGVSVDANTALNARTTMLTDYSYVKDNGEDAQALALGARYDITPMSYVEAQGVIDRVDGETGKGLRAGLGFRF